MSIMSVKVKLGENSLIGWEVDFFLNNIQLTINNAPSFNFHQLVKVTFYWDVSLATLATVVREKLVRAS